MDNGEVTLVEACDRILKALRKEMKEKQNRVPELVSYKKGDGEGWGRGTRYLGKRAEKEFSGPLTWTDM